MARRPLVNPFQRDVLDQRARLILRERSLDAEIKRQIERLTREWTAAIRAFAQSRSLSATEVAQLARRASILTQLNALTRNAIAQIESSTDAVVRRVFREEAYRLTANMAGFFERAVAQGASFSGINLTAASVAASQPVPGLRALFGRAAANIDAALRRDLSEAIADGWDVDKLARKWARASGGSASSIGYSRASAIVRTGVMSAANNAAIYTYQNSAAQIRLVRWEATFDSRTCLTCGSYHGKVYPIDNAPAMPAHLNCRCTWIPVFEDPALNAQLSKQSPYVASTEFRRHDRAFATWLKGQTAGTQRDFFGSELKYRSFKDRRLRLEQMVRRDGSILSDRDIARKLKDPAYVRRVREDLRKIQRGPD